MNIFYYILLLIAAIILFTIFSNYFESIGKLLNKIYQKTKLNIEGKDDYEKQ